ncbi:MAG TPA: hypothetical protein VIK81_04805 [Patescibacteria group bacterium]
MKRKPKILIGVLIICALFALAFVWYLLGGSKLSSKAPLSGEWFVSQMAGCRNGEKKNECYRKLAGTLTRNYQITEILKVITDEETDPEVYADCHTLAHFVGQEAFKQIKDVGIALGFGTYACFEGYQHGVVEGYVIQNNLNLESENLKDITPSICGNQERFEKKELYSQCLHGIGHAAMLLTESEVPEALSICDYLKQDFEKRLCYSGVFMENSNSSTNPDHPSKYYRADDPFYPCTILNLKYQEMCFELQSFKFFEFSSLDWPKTFEMCTKIPIAYQKNCYKTLGSSQVGFTKDFEIMKQNCDLTPFSYNNTCIRGVVSTLSTRFGGDVERMAKFCLAVDANAKNSCYGQMGASLKLWTKNQQEVNVLCSKVLEAGFENGCREGN